MKKKAYVIGSNVRESLSPFIFNYWFNKAGINNEYNHLEIKPKNFNKEINKLLNKRNVCGFNVTIPYKEKIIHYLDKIDAHATKIGAVNCVTRKNGLWVGTNTDWIGFAAPLLKRKFLKKNCAAIIGYGGAAKAIIYSLQKMGYKEIKIFNRTFKKIENLGKFKNISPYEILEIENHTKKIDLIVNTTPTNVLKKPNNMIFKKKIISYDVVYNPKETNFLQQFNEKSRVFGINMLVYQAAPCFERWFGEKAVADKVFFKALEKELS
jgi:shikimate dehydrogenase